MKIRLKKDGSVGTSSRFNIHTCCPQEIMVYFPDWTDTDFVSEYDVWIEAKQEWKDLRQAFKDRDVIVDNHNTRFFEPQTEEDRERGCTLH